MRLSLGKTVVFLSTILSLALLTGCSLGTAEMEKTDIDVLSEKSSKSWEQAETTPLGKYPELVTYTLGQMKGANNSNLPDGQTYEDNAYTRYLKKTLNIQNKNVFMERNFWHPGLLTENCMHFRRLPLMMGRSFYG